jgi:hypothetical protein
MPVDTRGLCDEHIGRRLQLELVDGRTELVQLLELTVCAEPEPCCGATYRLLHRNPTDASKAEGSVYWVGFGEIRSFRVAGEAR